MSALHLLSDLSFQVSPGLDGITGLMVRRQNLKRMGLLTTNGNDGSPVAFKMFQKKAVLQEIAKRGKDSDWNDHKAVIKASERLDKLFECCARSSIPPQKWEASSCGRTKRHELGLDRRIFTWR